MDALALCTGRVEDRVLGVLEKSALFGHDQLMLPLDRLTVVVLNWETPELTVRCLRALLDDGVPPARVVVVDNGSRDGSAERLRGELPECVVHALGENVGYARAANAGAGQLDGEAYLIMNNDAFVHQPGSVQTLVDALADSSVGLVVPRLRNEDLTLQPTVRPLPTPGVSMLRATGLGRLIPNRWQPNWSHHWDHATSRAIDAADGAVVLVRGETWRQLGGYNEARRMYAEDSDLCWRARRFGWRIWFSTDSEFIHLGNATVSRRWTDPQRASMIGREESRLLREQLSPSAARLSIAATSVYLRWRGTAYRLRGDREIAAALRAEREGYTAAD
jgi:N-acetylglucosaminyl-diphospho-decaprenol L-rhamnosyltransferase